MKNRIQIEIMTTVNQHAPDKKVLKTNYICLWKFLNLLNWFGTTKMTDYLSVVKLLEEAKRRNRWLSWNNARTILITQELQLVWGRARSRARERQTCRRRRRLEFAGSREEVCLDKSPLGLGWRAKSIHRKRVGTWEWVYENRFNACRSIDSVPNCLSKM